MPWKKYEAGKDELKPGMKIRLGGLEATIYDRSVPHPSGIRMVKRIGYDWGNSTLNDGIDISGICYFPDLEIFVQPLTIPRKTKEELAKKYHDPAIGYEEFSKFIENLEVTED